MNSVHPISTARQKYNLNCNEYMAAENISITSLLTVSRGLRCSGHLPVAKNLSMRQSSWSFP